ncbi:hypothetical protein [Pasteuria penetrans]|uniref:hypothetical protein n=1 Tax=Pasteuria penetrans TaxID=86005 RepID=UPI000F989FA0|nr:hypothetical protein [Pasteuria penetrans]
MGESVIVHPTARIGTGSVLGPFTIVDAGVVIGDGVRIGSHGRIYAGTRIGDRVTVGDQALLGVPPYQHSRPSSGFSSDGGGLPVLRIGEDGLFGHGVVLYRGAEVGTRVTMGDFSWVRERCTIGQAVHLGCRVSLSHNVIIESGAQLHSHSYLGAYTYVESSAVLASGVLAVSDPTESGKSQQDLLSRMQRQGPRISKDARVGSGAILLSNVLVRAGDFVQAGEFVEGPRS